MSQTLLVIFAIPLGLIAGGFATMLVDRIPDDTPLRLRSRCPGCEHELGWADTIPVLGWLRLRGRCRHCGARITPAYPAVEVVTAALFALVALRYDQTEWLILVPLVLVVALVALSTIDFYVYRLPDRIVFPALAISFVFMAVLAVVEVDRPSALVRAGVGAFGYCAFLLILHLVNPKGMGFGDVKLALLLGLHTGWVGGVFYGTWTSVIRLTFWAMFLGVLAGTILGLVLVFVRRFVDRNALPDPEAELDDDGRPTASLRKMAVPFGPGLAIGTVIVVLFPQLVL
jgi:leader peptidase (prepilin peptidase)/N-methyltransferase